MEAAALERGWAAVPEVLPPAAARAWSRRCRQDLEEDARQGDKRAGGTLIASDLLRRHPDLAAVFAHAGVVKALKAWFPSPPPLVTLAWRCPQPGYGEQSLHADDVPISHAGECRVVTCILALCDFTPDNGATAVVPGSHLRPDLQRRREPRQLPEVMLTGEAGTAFVFSGHLLHRGTRNRSAEPRPALQAQWRLARP